MKQLIFAENGFLPKAEKAILEMESGEIATKIGQSVLISCRFDRFLLCH
ncbi:MAG: hypothetical protein QMB55_06445 [Propionivibrio sp.]